MAFSPPSPCIGICSTVYGDDFCRGCKREYREVINWNSFEPAQKQAVLERLQQQIEIVMTDFLSITDIVLLKTQLDRAALQPPIYSSPWCWAHELLRLKATAIKYLGDYGLQAHPQYQALSSNALFTLIDDKLYALVQLPPVLCSNSE